MLEWVTDKIAELEELVRAGAVLVAIWFVVSTWWKTKALIPTVTAMLMAGAVLWAINNIEWFEAKVGEEASNGLLPWTFRRVPASFAKAETQREGIP